MGPSRGQHQARPRAAPGEAESMRSGLGVALGAAGLGPRRGMDLLARPAVAVVHFLMGLFGIFVFEFLYVLGINPLMDE